MEQANRDHALLFTAMPLISLAFIAAAFLAGGPLQGLFALWGGVNAYVSDAAAVGGLGAALLNGGLMGLFAWAVLLLARAKAAGRALGPFFLCMGLGLFGANVFCALPIVLGGFLYSRLRREPFSRTALYALQGCALSPAVAALYLGTSGTPSLGGALLGLLAGAAVGFLCLPLALHTRPLHQGYNLFGMGIPLGVMGILLFAVYRDTVLVPQGLAVGYVSPMRIGEARPLFFYPLFGLVFALLFLAGRLLRRPGGPPYRALFAHPGLEADFAHLFGAANVLQNAGLTGALLLAYFYLVAVPFSGAAAGALLCGLCWAGAGAHPRNVFPLLLGYCFTSLLLNTPLNAPELVIGVCFATGLAPISGRLGGIYGLLSGSLHAFLMPAVLGLNGGFNLCTGAFASGVVALALFPLLYEIERRRGEQAAAVRPGVAGELLHDASQIVDGMDGALSHVEAAPANPYENHPLDALFLLLRNALACLAAALFFLSLFPAAPLVAHRGLLRFIAYILGAFAYGSEILVLTNAFRQKRPLREMLMPYMFGVLYIVLGFSYLWGH